VLAAVVFLLAWANGANDNFKGVATLYGCQTVGFRAARLWCTIATAAGAVVSLMIAEGLLMSFSGGGVLAAEEVTDSMLASTGLASGATILLATLWGMPASTTHALIGALVGSALSTNAGDIHVPELVQQFVQPLLLSPIIAMVLAMGLYGVLRWGRQRLRVTSESCVCLARPAPALAGANGFTAVQAAGSAVEMRVADAAICVERYRGCIMGIRAQSIVDAVHVAGSGAVCFARAVNDTPKIAALLFGATFFAGASHIGMLIWVIIPMLLGGWLQSRRVAQTVSYHITSMNTGQGLTANLIAALLVISASQWALPVSTTHVVCGAICGIAAMNRKADFRVIGQIVSTWAATVPLGLVLGFVGRTVLQQLGID
jgi:PiT family inorganic phosphate transporter